MSRDEVEQAFDFYPRGTKLSAKEVQISIKKHITPEPPSLDSIHRSLRSLSYRWKVLDRASAGHGEYEYWKK